MKRVVPFVEDGVMITPGWATTEAYGISGRDERPNWLPLAAAGAAVVVLALSKRSTLLGLGAVLAGGYLLYRAQQSGSLRDLPDLGERLREQVGAIGSSGRDRSPAEPQDMVDEASMESFPGSDPPSRY